MLREGWSDPPALQWVTYARRKDAILPSLAPASPILQEDFRCAKYALSSRVLPRVEETLPFAKRIREHLMGIHKVVNNGNFGLTSHRFSGKDSEGSPLKGHTHAVFQPLDEDGDGRLDHLLVYAMQPFSQSELMALDRLHSVWQPRGRPDVRLVLAGLYETRPTQLSKTWISATPFVTARHYRKGRGTFEEWLQGEIVSECLYHGLPEPTVIEWIEATATGTRRVRWFEFARHYKDESPLSGYGCVLQFGVAVNGPFSIGSLCHYGLGLFIAKEADSTSERTWPH